MKRIIKKSTIRLKLLLLSFVFIALVPFSLSAQQFTRYTTVIDTPTAFTIAHGTYQFGLMAYDGGGLDFKALVGLTDQFLLGASFDVEHAVGQESPVLNIPSVIAKFKITDGTESFPISFSLGYDAFYMGATHKVTKYDAYGDPYRVREPMNQIVYGPYFVVTKPIYLLDDEQHVSFGMRMPVQPEYAPNDSSYFLSVDVPIGEYFVLKAETERIYYNFARSEEWLYNAGFRYNIFTKVGLELNFMMQRNEIPNRSIKVEYTDAF